MVDDLGGIALIRKRRKSEEDEAQRSHVVVEKAEKPEGKQEGQR